MDESELEGSMVLERLAEVDKVQDFYDAIDADNFVLARELMELVNTDENIIRLILKKVEDGE